MIGKILITLLEVDHQNDQLYFSIRVLTLMMIISNYFLYFSITFYPIIEQFSQVKIKLEEFDV